MHKRIFGILWVLVLGTGLLLPTGGCGGGGGSAGATAPPDVSLLTGTYFWALLNATDEAPATDEVMSQWGTADADGAGAMMLTVAGNENGFINPSAQTTVSYTVAADGTWAWQVAASDLVRGGISSDGRIAGGATIRPGADPRSTC